MPRFTCKFNKIIDSALADCPDVYVFIFSKENPKKTSFCLEVSPVIMICYTIYVIISTG